MDEYPNSSDAWQPEPPAERVKQEEDEKAKMTSSVGIVKDVLSWFETQLDTYKSVSSLNVTADSDPTNVLAQVIAAQNLTKAYEAKLAEFKVAYSKNIEEEEANS